MNLYRRSTIGILACATLWAASASTAFAQGKSLFTRPVTLVLPFPAGGATDVIARAVGKELQERVGQPVLIDNRPGGNTLIATNYVMAQRPDGHTLYFASWTSIEQPVLRPTIAKFDPTVDLTPISLLGKVKFVLVVNPALRVSNAREFIQLAKSRPNGLSVAIIGQGAADHLAGELIAQRTGAKLLAVTYKGSAPALVDVAAGVVDARIGDFASARSFIDSGKVKMIASAELKREANSTMETIAETVPGVQVPVWFALLGPKGMAPETVKYLNGEIAAILQLPEIREKMRGLSIEPVTSTSEELREGIRARMAEVSQIVRERNLKFDN